MNNQYGYYNNMPQGNGYYPPQNQGYQQYQQQYQPQTVMNTNQEDPKKKKVWIIGIIAIVAIIIVAVFFLLRGSSSFKRGNYTFETLKNTDAFFLPDSDVYYALFNEDGKKLTDYQFDKIGEFYGGVAKVVDADGKPAIIRDDGSYLVELTEDKITDYQSLFLIEPKDHSKMKLINYEGKTILEEESIKVSSFDDSSLFVVTSGDAKTAKIMNYKGEILDELTGTKFSKSPKVINGLVTLMDGTKTYLYNLDTGKKVYEIEGSYCIMDNEDNSIVLSSCSSPDTIRMHKAIKDNKEVFTVSKSLCSSIEIMKDGNFICKASGSNVYRFMNTNGSLKNEVIVGYHNQNDYVVRNGSGLIFYVDNQERYRASCINLEKTATNGYIIKNYTYGECSNNSPGMFYYSKAGEKNSNSFYNISEWDSNDKAIVSNKEGNYYLVNEKLEKISRDYIGITSINSFYIGQDENKENKLFTVDQKEIEQGFKNYKTISRPKNKGDILALIYSDKVVFYNSSSGAKMHESSGRSVSLFEHYYTIGNSYYSYTTGEQFYSKE